MSAASMTRHALAATMITAGHDRMHRRTNAARATRCGACRDAAGIDDGRAQQPQPGKQFARMRFNISAPVQLPAGVRTRFARRPTLPGRVMRRFRSRLRATRSGSQR